jgi:Zn-dependent protease with chaperone function/Zn-finger nucleic acid-binding protein
MATERFARDFYEAQAAQKRKSLGLLAVLVAFYVITLSGFLAAAALLIGVLAGRPVWSRPGLILAAVGLGVLIALAIVAYQVWDARKNGAAYILNRLGARLPDVQDRYHRRAADVVERIRIAAGLPQAATRIIPDHTINALAIVESDGAPIVGLTEGLLADFEEDELEAVAAHEIAHIVRGDAALMTLVCAIADSFERMMDSRRPADNEPDDAPLPLSLVLIRLLSRFVAREREGLADAAAVELGRNPAALARALTKAHFMNTFIGDFHETYSPIFLVAPEASSGGDVKPVWADTHPPLMERVRMLAGMAHEAPEEIIRDVWRERTRRAAGRRTAAAAEPEPVGELAGGASGKPAAVSAGSGGRCPRCAEDLVETDYEGVTVLACRSCGGKLVRSEDMDRILIRRELGFDAELHRKAAGFRERFVRNPLQTMKVNDRIEPARRCPACGYRLVSRPFNYQYFVPVERCLDCGRIWFDADELEVLQILVEEASKE